MFRVMIVGADIGKYQARFMSERHRFTFKSKLYPSRHFNVENELGENDLVIEYDGKTYLGGDLGEREGEIPIAYSDESKAYPTTLINLLAGLHRLPSSSFQVVIGTPISKRNKIEKDAIKEMVKKSHIVTVNGKKKMIIVHDIEVAAEGASGFFSEELRTGEIQGLDFGSTTTNYFYMKDKKLIDRKSGTFPFGAENMITKNKAGMMESIYSQLSNRFKDHVPTMVMGGHSYEMMKHVLKYYPNAYMVTDPIFATCEGFYKTARAVYA